jgi:hypothetical protein
MLYECESCVVCGQDRKDDEYISEIKRITIPINKLNEFIVLLFGTENITLRENHFSITKVLDLTNTNIMIQETE